MNLVKNFNSFIRENSALDTPALVFLAGIASIFGFSASYAWAFTCGLLVVKVIATLFAILTQK